MGKGPRRQNSNWAQAARDVTVAAINKGQLLTFGILVLFGIILVRLEPPDLNILATNIVNRFTNSGLLPWSLLGISNITWIISVRFIRKSSSVEFFRIGKEKSTLQAKLSGGTLSSSD